MKERIQELIARECNEAGGTKITNCMVHQGRPLTDRPNDCRLCSSDVQSRLADAIAINEWLNKWKDDATKVLENLESEDWRTDW